MKIIWFIPVLLLLVSCENNDRFYGEIVETNEQGEILNNRDDQWAPRMNFSEILNSNFDERESWPELSVYPAYPNPFKNETTSCFRIKWSGNVGVILFDEQIGKLDTLFYSRLAAGSHCWIWQGFNNKYNSISFDSLKNGNYQFKIFTTSEGEKLESFGNIKINK